MSTSAEPLNRLRRNVVWRFGAEEKATFEKLKSALTSCDVLVQYDPTRPIRIQTDASGVGIGAVISHVMQNGEERPIEFTSRTLTSAERHYSQIEKEALSLVWGVKKFHRYIYAREFELTTDHRPLLFLLSEKKGIPEMGVSRIQRWAIILSSYQYKINYRPTGKHANADLCSRFPLTDKVDVSDLLDGDKDSDVFFTTFADKPLINHELIRKYTHTDPVLRKIRRFIQDGWDNTVRAHEEFKSYYEKRNELTVEYDCELWGARVVVPTKLRRDVLELIHSTHQGVVAMKGLARSYCWWPKITADIEEVSRSCEACVTSLKNPTKTTPHPWIPATKPWERIHLDFAGPFQNKMWMIVVDAYSKWMERSSTLICDQVRLQAALLRSLDRSSAEGDCVGHV